MSLGLRRAVSRLAVIVLALGSFARGAETVSVAAASNLVYVLDALTAEFKRGAPGVAVTLTTGASGSLFAQIKQGAPFDVFLSADTEYPREAVAQRIGAADTLRVFATGRLALWTTRDGLDLTDLATVVRGAKVRKIALANPLTAPYGRAAQAALAHAGVKQEAAAKLVVGENISQTAQFVETGNAEVGFVALSLVLSPRLRSMGTWREIPAAAHPGVTLEHAGVLTQRGAQYAAARRYLDFLGSEPAKKILREFGYGVP